MTFSHTLSVSDRILKKLESGAAWVGAAALAGLLAVTLLEVFRRNVFGKPIHGLVDMIEWFLPFVALAGVSAAQAYGEHFRMEIIVKTLKGRWRWGVEALTSVGALFFVVIVAIYSVRAALKAWSVGYISADIEWPLWPPKLALAVVFILLSFRLLIQTAGFSRLVINPDSNREGLPDNLLTDVVVDTSP